MLVQTQIFLIMFVHLVLSLCMRCVILYFGAFKSLFVSVYVDNSQDLRLVFHVFSLLLAFVILEEETWTHPALSCRSNIVPKLIFIDQLCELCPYLLRSTLEIHIPYAIIRSMYRQHYGNSSMAVVEILAPSPRQSPAVSLAHASPAIRHQRGDSTPQSSAYDSSYFSVHQQEEYDSDMKAKPGSKQHPSMRRSGPLDYGSSRKVKFVEGSTSGSRGPSPLPRFAVSRSGPLLDK